MPVIERKTNVDIPLDKDGNKIIEENKVEEDKEVQTFKKVIY